MKELLKKSGVFAAVLLFLPAVAFAQEDLQGIINIVNAIDTVINTLIPVVFALILLVFFWGLAKYVLNADNEDARDQGKRIMIGGVIALFVAASIWGLVAWIGDLFEIDQGESQVSPGVSS